MKCDMKQSKLVYIASPYARDVEANVIFVKAACQYAIRQCCTPIAVHLLYPQLLDDSVPKEREAGLQMGRRVLEACDELWLCGERMSAGMQEEKDAALRFDIPVRHISEKEITMELSPPVMELCLC